MSERGGDDLYQDYSQLKTMKMNFNPKPMPLALVEKPKYMYPLFNLFELELSRFHQLPEFSRLESEVAVFNSELQEWKDKDTPVRNLFPTYHLYQCLFSRMKYTANLVLDRAEAKRVYVEMERWFTQEKPKVRNKAPDKEEPILKQLTEDKETETEVDSLLVSNINKRQLRVYEAMTRTSHTQFFPPKERLLEYKKRDLLEGNLHSAQPRRASSVSTLAKGGMARYRGSFATTRTSFKSTQAQSKEGTKADREEPVVVPFQMESPKKGDEDVVELGESGMVEELDKEKQVQQDELLQQNIAQVVHEEDQIDLEELESEEEKREEKRFRKYRNDPNADLEMAAEENIKDVKQSTLRRILKQKEEVIRRKMEELSMAQQMGNWGALKSKQNTEEHRKLERMHLANQYRQLEYAPKTLKERQSERKKSIPEFQTFYRSKSSRPSTIEEEVQGIKIKNALKTYGKYINHVKITPIKPESEEEKEEIRVMRSTSLTSFCRQGKKTPFSSIVEQHGVDSYNDEAIDQMRVIKDRLAKTAIPVEKREILLGVGVPDARMMDLPDSKAVFPPHKTMFNNPFFPKQAKSKKNKN